MLYSCWIEIFCFREGVPLAVLLDLGHRVVPRVPTECVYFHLLILHVYICLPLPTVSKHLIPRRFDRTAGLLKKIIPLEAGHVQFTCGGNFQSY